MIMVVDVQEECALQAWLKRVGRRTWPLLLAAALSGCDQQPSLGYLIDSGDTRPTRGRLDGASAHRPYAPQSTERRTHRWARTLRAVIAAARHEEDSAALHRLGVAWLVEGRHDRAIEVLGAAAQSSGTLAVWNDLAVAYLARFDTRQHPLDLLRAVNAADRAIEGPQSTVPLFNRTLALRALGTARLATLAASKLVEHETEAGWREEIESTANRFDASATSWAEARRKLAEATVPLSDHDAEALVRRFPLPARRFAEETLFGQWASRVVAGDAAGAEVRRVQTAAIGRAVAGLHDDHLLADSARRRQEVWASGTEADLASLLDGLVALDAGMAAYRGQRYRTAGRQLGLAVSRLEALGFPLAELARFFLSVCRSYEHTEEGRRDLEQMAEAVDEKRYPGLAGLVHWMLGTVDRVNGRLPSALKHFFLSRTLNGRSAGPAGEAFGHVLVAEVLSMLGQHDAGWIERLPAFHGVPRLGEPRRQIALWTEAANALRRQDALELAGPMLDEAVLFAQIWDQPLGLVTAHLERAAYRASIEDRAGARADLAVARAAIDDMEESGFRDRMRAYTDVTEARIVYFDQPRRTVALLSEAFARQRTIGFDLDRIQYASLRARARASIGDVDGAIDGYREAVAMFEGIRATVENPFERMNAFRIAQPAFESLMAIELDNGARDPAALFALAERSRARVQIELIAPELAAVQGTQDALDRLAGALPAGVTAVEFAVLPDRLLAWVVTPGHRRMIVEPVDAEALRTQIETLRAMIQLRAAEARILPLAAELYDRLIRPLSLGSEASTLVIVPDRFLRRVPWPVLHDSAHDRSLLAERPLATSPSAAVLEATLDRPSASTERGVLVIGAGSESTYGSRGLPPLNAAEEARAIATTYPDATLRIGSEASRSIFLADVTRHAIVHFAGHALADPEVVGRSVLLFENDVEGKAVTVALSEVIEMSLAPVELVVLSACQTLDSNTEDREGMLGLGGAFLAAGASAVLASLWDVDDAFAVDLMPRFHRHFATGISAAEALRSSLLEVVEASPDDPIDAADWANFALLGGMTR